MFGLESLDVLIGLVTIYLVFVLACTAIVETIAAGLSLRSKNLELALKKFFEGILSPSKTFIDAFYAHPLVQALSKDKNGRPSYIPPEVVGQVVQALITANGAVTSIKDAVAQLPGTGDSNRFKGLLETLEMQASGDVKAFRKAVETHFDAVMDRASGWVKRCQQTVALAVSVVLVCVVNVDTLTLTTALSSSPEVRAEAFKIAEQVLKEKPAPSAKQDDAKTEAEKTKPPDKKPEEFEKALDASRATLEASGLQFGWKDCPSVGEWPAKILGLLLSIFAISLGAPFWFDLLQRFMQVRQAGVSPREKKDEKK